MIFDLIDYILGHIKFAVYKLAYLKHIKYSLVNKFSRGCKIRLFGNGTIEIGRNCVFRYGTVIRCVNDGLLTIGDGVGFNNYCLINVMDKVQIGDDTIIGQGVKIYDHDHDYRKEGKRRYTGFKTEPVTIGRNVWIGSGVIILRGTRIGDDCVIGAGCVVKGYVEANTVLSQRLAPKNLDRDGL